MKARVFVGLLILILTILTISINQIVFSQENLGSDCQEIEQTLVFKDDPLFPKGAKAKITYCKAYEETFQILIDANGFPKSESFRVTLNGCENCPGNEELKRFNTHGNEGFVDIGTVKADNYGRIRRITKFNLQPAEYRVKMFLKQNEQPFRCVMGYDLLSFNISPPDPITFILPEELTNVPHLIKGNVTDASKPVYIFVCPMITEKWWVQKVPIVDRKKGTWSCLCFFGTKTEGIGEHYKVIALIGKKKGEFKRGDIIAQSQMQSILDEYQSYTMHETKRIN